MKPGTREDEMLLESLVYSGVIEWDEALNDVTLTPYGRRVLHLLTLVEETEAD